MSDSLDCMTMIFGLSSTFFMFIFMIVSFVQLSDIRNRMVAIEHNVDLVERMLRSLKDTVKTAPPHPTTAPRAPQKVPTPQRTAPEPPERLPIQSPSTATADTLPAEPSALPNASPKTTEATDAPASQTTPPSHTPQTPVEDPSKPSQAEPTDVPIPEAIPTHTPTSAPENTTEANTAEPSVEPPQHEPTSPSLSPDRTTQTDTTQRPKPAPESPPSARPRGASSVLERGIGGTAAVWVGAAALALAGALLVQYSIEQELLSARARVGAAAGSGILLLMLGEWLTHRIRLVGGGLLAAGVAVLYSAFVAATMIYPILNPWLGAGLMVATTATAATMAIRHDMLIIAVLGLLGGFVTPIVSGIQPDNPILFFGYLLLLNIGVIVVAWKRSWPILTYLALLLSFTTELGWTSTTSTTPTAPYLIMVALLTGPFAVAGHMGLTRPKRDTDTPHTHNSSTWLLISASLTMPIMIGLLSGVRWAHSPFLWVQQGLLATLMFVMAALNERYRPLPWVAWLLLATQQAAWLFDAPDGAHVAWVAGSAMLLFGLGSSFLALRQPQRLGEPTALVVMLAGQTAIAYGYAPTRTLLDHWGVPMLMVAVWLLAIAGLMHQRHHDNDTPRPRAIPILVVAASAFVALAFALELHDQWITTAWTIQALVVLFIGLRFKEQPMLWVSTVLAVMVAWRLIPYPWLLEELSGGHPVFNTTLYLYSVTALGAFTASHLHARYSSNEDNDIPMTLYGLSGLAIVLLGVTLIVRHAFHPDFAGEFTRPEHLAYSLSWAGVGIATLVVGLIRHSTTARIVSLLLISGTSLKVFLFDLSYLTGLGRVASVAGLGAVMIVIAVLYRLYIFPTEEETNAPASSQDEAQEPNPNT